MTKSETEARTRNQLWNTSNEKMLNLSLNLLKNEPFYLVCWPEMDGNGYEFGHVFWNLGHGLGHGLRHGYLLDLHCATLAAHYDFSCSTNYTSFYCIMIVRIPNLGKGNDKMNTTKT